MRQVGERQKRLGDPPGHLVYKSVARKEETAKTDIADSVNGMLLKAASLE